MDGKIGQQGMPGCQGTKRILVMPTEVYSRVVGYYRPVDNWNHGKRQEFEERSDYDKVFKEVIE